MNGKRVLVVDDEPSIVDAVSTALRYEGYEVFPAALAGCTAVTLARYERTKGWNLGEIRVDVDFNHHSEPRLVGVDVQFEAELTATQMSRVEKVAAACPLRRSLALGFEFEERITAGRRTAA